MFCNRIIAKSLPPYSEIASTIPQSLLGRKTRSSPENTLILDLDETLVYSSCNPIEHYDSIITLQETFIPFKALSIDNHF